MKTLLRQDDAMIAVESCPATIDFEDILEATEVVPDELMSEAPWDSWDGWEHTATPTLRMDDAKDYEKMQGLCWDSANRERVVITLEPGNDYGIYQYHRDLGASRQVAREAVAAEKRRTIATLVNWYENGYEWWCVECCFKMLGQRFTGSVGGIDDSDYAETLCEDVAFDVAHQLEKAGFTVTNKPVRQTYTRADKQANLQRHLQSQSWAA